MKRRVARRFVAGGALVALVATQLLVTVGVVSAAGAETFKASLSGAQESPAVSGSGTGSATFTISADGTSIAYSVTYSGLTGAVVAAHIHAGSVGVSGPIILPLTPAASPMTGTLTAADFKAAGGITTFDGALAAIRAGGTYVNLHTAAHPGGEIRGQLNGPETFNATLTGASEVPAVQGNGVGFATIVIADDEKSITYTVTYAGLTGDVVAAHIHVGDLKTAGPIILPLKVGPTPMTGTLTAADLKAAGGVNSFADAVAAIRAGNTYVNLHTAAHPGGEVRGQLVPPGNIPQIAIIADRPQSVPKGHFWTFNDYFPRTATVATGTSVSFSMFGFHTGTLLPTGTTVAADMANGGVAKN
ncbi:MAG TPA: CHRD domain-containing protein, partial [Mycobacterium sp.]|nr:CHRD domain-containing protein [Mycobacterium sp.]